MSATVAAALKKIAIYILGDEKKRGKLFVLIGSIAAGFLGLMCLPVAVLSSMGSLEIETPEVDRSMFTDSAFMATLDEDQQSQIAEFQSQGEAIAAAMSVQFLVVLSVNIYSLIVAFIVQVYERMKSS